MISYNVLDLFSGTGGISIGLESAGMKTVAFCESDKYCKKVLKKHWPDVPIFNDVRSLDYDGTVDIICGGFPCQPFSCAGEQKGKEDDRHLWPAMFDLVKKYRPRWVIGENVTGIVNMALDDVLDDLEGEGYTTRTFIIPACALDTDHRRDRVFILAYATCDRLQNGKLQQRVCTTRDSIFTNGSIAAVRVRQGQAPNRTSFCGMVDGISNRAHRIRLLGNAVVPQILELIGRLIMQIEATDLFNKP